MKPADTAVVVAPRAPPASAPISAVNACLGQQVLREDGKAF